MSERLTHKGFDLLADDGASADDLAAWFAAAHDGDGAPWLAGRDADALARYALMRGHGVSLMEAAARAFREPVRETGWEILGDDPDGENWADHHDPERAYALFRAKLARARADGVSLLYKIWLAPGA